MTTSTAPLTPGGFQNITGVSRETRARLETYANLLNKWQKAINLVSASTLPDLWRRHMLDSAQLYPLLPKGAETLVDFGSGAGFPALVLAIMGVPNVHVVESDTRKCSFMRQVARETGTSLSVHNCRIEDLSPFPADIITARALAPLESLLKFAKPFTTPSTKCLFLKGKSIQEELTAANYLWHIKYRLIESLSDPDGSVLVVEEYRDVCEDTDGGHAPQS